MPKVYIVNDQSPNAFATGRDKDHAAVAVTTGLLDILDRNELSGVVAHELAHIGNRDILLSTVIVVLVGFVSLLADIFIRGSLGGSRSNGRGGNIVAVVGVVFVILSPIFAKLIQLAISRKREFLADASAVSLTRYPEGLASALRKISGSARPLERNHQAISHLYIANPLSARGKISNLFSTHPPTEARIKALVGH
jgi:heat shock protein HtpX